MMAVVHGLEGVVAAETEIGHVDGENGVLLFRGYSAQDLAQEASFEAVAYLLLSGGWPSPEELRSFEIKLQSYRSLSPLMADAMDRIPRHMDMMSVVRTCVSLFEAFPLVEEGRGEERIAFLAQCPVWIAYRQARLSGRDPIEPHPTLSHVANYLYMLGGETPKGSHVRALETYLILAMEHGMNASTFAARVVASTGSDVASALCAAVGAMKGPLHGGAPSEVMTMLEQIGAGASDAAIRQWLEEELNHGRRLMGFGHRVYRTMDPRALALRHVVSRLSQEDPWFDLAVRVEAAAIPLLRAHKPNRRLFTNVEYWAAAVLRTVQLPKHLYTPTFTVARFVGWLAHVDEQARHNRIIRPQSVYVGPVHGRIPSGRTEDC